MLLKLLSEKKHINHPYLTRKPLLLSVVFSVESLTYQLIYLYIMLLIVFYLNNICLTQTHKDLYYKIYIFIVISLGFALTSMINFKLIFMWHSALTHSFQLDILIASCSITVFWKDYLFSVELAWHIWWKSVVCICGGLISEFSILFPCSVCLSL